MKNSKKTKDILAQSDKQAVKITSSKELSRSSAKAVEEEF